jgi:hypothetical protein
VLSEPDVKNADSCVVVTPASPGVGSISTVTTPLPPEISEHTAPLLVAPQFESGVVTQVLVPLVAVLVAVPASAPVSPVVAAHSP